MAASRSRPQQRGRKHHLNTEARKVNTPQTAVVKSNTAPQPIGSPQSTMRMCKSRISQRSSIQQIMERTSTTTRIYRTSKGEWFSPMDNRPEQTTMAAKSLFRRLVSNLPLRLLQKNSNRRPTHRARDFETQSNSTNGNRAEEWTLRQVSGDLAGRQATIE